MPPEKVAFYCVNMVFETAEKILLYVSFCDRGTGFERDRLQLLRMTFMVLFQQPRTFRLSADD